ncbi:MAG: hypothetical protein V2B20_10250, partial [Pseudomonadota bacterium]
TACCLAVLRLISEITLFDPRTRYPVAGQPSGTGFSPARMYNLARPHKKSLFRALKNRPGKALQLTSNAPIV